MAKRVHFTPDTWGEALSEFSQNNESKEVSYILASQSIMGQDDKLNKVCCKK